MRPYTCDAMMGKALGEDFKALKVARKRIHDTRLVFTTCIGAGLGLVRNENFNTVIIDEASQQTEPMSLVPLVKCCTKTILVGDHVQLRATVQPLALLQTFDVSLFERLFHESGPNFREVMLVSQPHGAVKARMVFVQCSSVEDMGRKSKSNKGPSGALSLHLLYAPCRACLVIFVTSDPHIFPSRPHPLHPPSRHPPRPPPFYNHRSQASTASKAKRRTWSCS